MHPIPFGKLAKQPEHSVSFQPNPPAFRLIEDRALAVDGPAPKEGPTRPLNPPVQSLGSSVTFLLRTLRPKLVKSRSKLPTSMQGTSGSQSRSSLACNQLNRMEGLCKRHFSLLYGLPINSHSNIDHHTPLTRSARGSEGHCLILPRTSLGLCKPPPVRLLECTCKRSRTSVHPGQGLRSTRYDNSIRLP